MTTYAEQGIQRRLIHAHSGWVKGRGKQPPVHHPELEREQRWLWQAVGPWRDTETRVLADLALLEADADLADALRVILFLAGEAVDGDPDDDEMRALLAVTALYELMEVAR